LFRLVQEVVMRLHKTTTGVAGALVCLAAGASVAAGATSSGTPAGGAIRIFVQPGQNQGEGKILFTGAVGDYGSSSPAVSSGGKKIGTATLTKGTIRIDLTAISAKVASVNPKVNAATCSASVTESAESPIVGGTGLYASIQGTIKITESFGYLGSTYKTGPHKGKCNTSNSGTTVAQMGIVYGKGTVSF
jgi:hypothetical protein